MHAKQESVLTSHQYPTDTQITHLIVCACKCTYTSYYFLSTVRVSHLIVSCAQIFFFHSVLTSQRSVLLCWWSIMISNSQNYLCSHTEYLSLEKLPAAIRYSSRSYLHIRFLFMKYLAVDFT